MGQYIVHSITIPISNTISAEHVSTTLTNLAKDICAPFLQTLIAISVMMKKAFLGIPSAKPNVAIFPVDAQHYKCVLRIVVPVNRLYAIEQEILRHFMTAIYDQNQKSHTLPSTNEVS